MFQGKTLNLRSWFLLGVTGLTSSNTYRIQYNLIKFFYQCYGLLFVLNISKVRQIWHIYLKQSCQSRFIQFWIKLFLNFNYSQFYEILWKYFNYNLSDEHKICDYRIYLLFRFPFYINTSGTFKSTWNV